MIEVISEYYNELNEFIVDTKTISQLEWDMAVAIVESSREGSTQYMTTVYEEAVARLLNTSACNSCCYAVRVEV
jgi:hypothetical protein